ncbi:MAG: methylated-DNA--[protein]-cysteine S-methyltransferase [Planctomycetaceae bacterium]|nr:methylated-DNA--[protein]-cysteine S-methyltransferase [Planctomycetaceae bacterium]
MATNLARAVTLRPLWLASIPTPLGRMEAAACDEGVCELAFPRPQSREKELASLCELLDAEVVRGSHPHLERLEDELTRYFEGKLKRFRVPLHAPGTPFDELAWKALLQIPWGETRSYGQQAALMGRPSASRAVGAANGRNRIAIVIPCHRVIGSTGKLVGYAAGVERKRFLLELERRDV